LTSWTKHATPAKTTLHMKHAHNPFAASCQCPAHAKPIATSKPPPDNSAKMGMTIGVITASTAASAMRNANRTANPANPMIRPKTLTI
jgi:hypothetical protein